MVYRPSFHHFISLIFLAVLLAGESHAGLSIGRDRNVCLTGDEDAREIDELIKGKRTSFNEGLLIKWRNLPISVKGFRTEIPTRLVPRACVESHDETLSKDEALARELAGIMSVPSPQKFVRRECIERAVVMRSAGLSPGEFIACEFKGESKKKPGTTVKALEMQEKEIKLQRINKKGETEWKKPCITEDYIDYIHWTLNQVINCLSDPGDPIDPEIIFRKLSRESAFAAYYRWSGGRGLAQMTGAAIKEMNPGDNGYKFLLDQMKKNEAACKQFEDIINPPNKNGEASLKSCQYISMGDGVARNLLHGVGLYLYYRNHAIYGVTAKSVLEDLGFESNPNFIRMRDYLTLMAFNLGNGGMQKYLNKHGIGKRKERPKMTFEEFKKIVDGQKYMGEVQETADEVLGTPPMPCSEDPTP